MTKTELQKLDRKRDVALAIVKLTPTDEAAELPPFIRTAQRVFQETTRELRRCRFFAPT